MFVNVAAEHIVKLIQSQVSVCLWWNVNSSNNDRLIIYNYLLSPQYTVLHILFYCTFYSLYFIIYLSYIYIYIHLCCVMYFAQSIEQT